jgi:hypothetical protein
MVDIINLLISRKIELNCIDNGAGRMRLLAYCAPANYSNENLDEIAELLIENGIESQLPKYSQQRESPSSLV